MDYVCRYCGKEFDIYVACVVHMSGCVRMLSEEVESRVSEPLSEDYKEFLLTIISRSPEYIEHYAR